MMGFCKLQRTAHTVHISFITPKKFRGTTTSQMQKFFILLIALSTWTLREHLLHSSDHEILRKEEYLAQLQGEQVLLCKSLVCHNRISIIKFLIQKHDIMKY